MGVEADAFGELLLGHSAEDPSGEARKALAKPVKAIGAQGEEESEECVENERGQ